MSFLAKVKQMFGRQRISQEPRTNDPIRAGYAKALERNELAGTRAREALEDLRMSETLREIAGKM